MGNCFSCFGDVANPDEAVVAAVNVCARQLQWVSNNVEGADKGKIVDLVKMFNSTPNTERAKQVIEERRANLQQTLGLFVRSHALYGISATTSTIHACCVDPPPHDNEDNNEDWDWWNNANGAATALRDFTYEELQMLQST